MLDHSRQAQRHSHVERGHDLYETPAVAVEALLRVLALPSGAIWGYDVPLMVSRGMPSLTFLHGSALAIRRAEERGKTSYIYQFGDHDPSGVLIPKAIERRLDEICQDLDCEPPYVERIALTKEQIEEHNLPTRPTKRDGNRHAHGFVGDSVELDALPPSTLRAIVRAVIGQHVSPEATQALRVAEDSERDLLRAWRVRALGEDRVQAILDEAFADADFRPLHAEVA